MGSRAGLGQQTVEAITTRYPTLPSLQSAYHRAMSAPGVQRSQGQRMKRACAYWPQALASQGAYSPQLLRNCPALAARLRGQAGSYALGAVLVLANHGRLPWAALGSVA